MDVRWDQKVVFGDLGARRDRKSSGMRSLQWLPSIGVPVSEFEPICCRFNSFNGLFVYVLVDVQLWRDLTPGGFRTATANWSVCLFVCLSVCLFVCLSVCLSVFLFVCLSVCLASQKEADIQEWPLKRASRSMLSQVYVGSLFRSSWLLSALLAPSWAHLGALRSHLVAKMAQHSAKMAQDSPSCRQDAPT